MIYLSVNDLIAINEVVVAQSGGARGILFPPALQEAASRPGVSMDDYEPFPTLWEKAAVLIDSLNRQAAFASANLSTSLIAADMMLRLNRHRLACSVEDTDQIRSFALGQMTIPQIAGWIRSKSEELK